jgi:RNA polymerase sigma-70 factor (ECF subfamily)
MTTQAEAIAALRVGDVSALAVLVRLHQLKALRTAYGIVGERAAAEDIVSDAFLRVFEGIHGFRAGRPFEPWFYRIVVNRSIDYRRTAERSSSTAEPLAVAEGSLDLDDRELHIVLAEQIAALPVAERAALVLRYYLDLDEASMAVVLSCPVGTVKSRLHRARQRLRVSLTDSEREWAATAARGG